MLIIIVIKYKNLWIDSYLTDFLLHYRKLKRKINNSQQSKKKQSKKKIQKAFVILLEINNQNSSEVWGGFRVANRAHPHDLLINERVLLH